MKKIELSHYLVSYFNKRFPLVQNESWHECHVPKDLLSSVTACLRGTLLPMASLLRQTQPGKSTGNTGNDTLPQPTLTRFSAPSVPPLERDLVTGAFAARVRTGKYGNGDQIKVSVVSDALAAISKTIELAGKPSPLYRAENKYQLHLERVVEGFRQTDPPTIPQLAVPVTVAHTAYTTNIKHVDPILRRTGCLVLVAFYFLLRVGEYTKPHFVVRNGKKVPATRTKQLVVGNIGFSKDVVVIPRTSPRDVLLTADLAVMKISNQNNVQMG